MPPKKSKGSRGSAAKSNAPIQTVNSISIQTEDNSSEDIENYKKQVKLLQTEIEDYKNQIIALQRENTLLRNQANNKGKIISGSNDTPNVGSAARNSLKLRSDKISSPGPKGKGCSCKGNCSNKICGCVKKGILCQEFCRCDDDQCKNQEPDKENVEQDLSKDGQYALEKLGRLTLNQEFLHASEKKAKRGIFSPFGGHNGITNGEAPYPASPLTFEAKRRLFSQNSDDIVDIDNDTSHEDAVVEPKHLNNIERSKELEIEKFKSQIPHTPITKRTRRLKYTEKNINVVENNKADSKLKTFEAVKAAEKQSKQLKQTIEKEADTQDPKQLQLPVIQLPDIDEENNKKKNFLDVLQLNVTNSPRVLRRKSKSASPNKYVSQRNYGCKKASSKTKSRSISPDDRVNYQQDTTTCLTVPKVQHSPQILISKVKPSISKQTLNISENQEPQVKVQLSLESNSNKSSLSFESNNSEGSTNSNNDVLDISLNPMVPKRQLPRSPINAAGNIIIPAQNKRFSPPKKELAVAEIDWEQHQSELIMCEICKRKFFPYRIEKHKIHCKGI